MLSGEYKKGDEGANSSSFNEEDIKNAEEAGVKNPTDVNAAYEAGDKDNPLSQKLLQFVGVYGEIEDPEKVVDAMFAELKKESDTDKGELVGSPKAFTPAGLDGAVLKCQETRVPGDETGEAGPKEIKMPVCIWGDHSTLGVTIDANIADALAGKGPDLAAAAEQAAKFRKEVRVKA